MTQFNPTYITFALYIIAVLGIGVAAYMATRNFGDYILGGRRLGGFVTAMAAGASDMSGWLLMGLPGAIYAVGLSEAWIAVGLTIGAYFNWLWVSGRLRVHTEFNNNALTLPEYFSSRFGEYGVALKVVSALIILIFFALYSASGVVAGARLFQTLFPELDYSQAMFLGAGATIVYTFIGGFLAVSWSDSLQATLMFFALIFAPIAVYLSLGGASEVSQAFEVATVATGVQYADIMGGMTAIGLISTLAWGLGYFGQPHILARFMAAENVRTLKKARRIGMTWMILCLVGAVLVGFFGVAYFYANPDAQAFELVKTNPELVFMELAKALFNPWIVGLILSAILAAVMSTLSAQLLVCSSALAEDFYKGFLRPGAGQTELVWFGRLMVLAVAIVAIFLARDPDSGVLSLVSYAWAGFGAAFGPVVIFSVFYRRTSALGALIGMIGGAATVLLWKGLPWAFLDGKTFAAYTGLYEMVPGFIVCAVLVFLISEINQAPERIQERFTQAEVEYYRQLS